MSLRIVFMGTPRFAVASLDALCHSEHEVVAVVTAPDKPAGRGKKSLPSEVKRYALQKGLKLLQPPQLKSPDFIAELKRLEADLQVVVAFRILPAVVWAMPPAGTCNLHASLLPQYRGAAPIHWAIINGETETGVTTFFIDEHVDTGPVLMCEKIPITQAENAGELRDKLMRLGAEVVLKTVCAIERESLTPKVQPRAERLKTAPKLDRKSCRLNWNDTAQHLFDKIRGLSPYPTAWTMLTDGQIQYPIKIFKAARCAGRAELNPGSLSLEKKAMRVATRDGWLSILELQAAGKRRMNAVNFLNGAHFNKAFYLK